MKPPYLIILPFLIETPLRHTLKEAGLFCYGSCLNVYSIFFRTLLLYGK